MPGLLSDEMRGDPSPRSRGDKTSPQGVPGELRGLQAVNRRSIVTPNRHSILTPFAQADVEPATITTLAHCDAVGWGHPLHQEYALRALTERPDCPTLLPFELGAASGSLGSIQSFAALTTDGSNAGRSMRNWAAFVLRSSSR